MKFVIDTTVWSIANRKKKHSERELKILQKLKEITSSHREIMLGAVRQELLSGISDLNAFNNLKEKLRTFEDYTPQTPDYELAAEFSNICRKNGIQGSTTDYLICAIAVKNDWIIFSEDADFLNYRKHIPIKVYGTD